MWICIKKFNGFFSEYLISDFDIYMHLLTWVGFSLIGYVPNTLYINTINKETGYYRY
jgi:hypothetical protein